MEITLGIHNSMQSSGDILSKTFPVFMIGAGGIVNTAHLPAYRIAGFDVRGIFDIDAEKAKATAEKFRIPQHFVSLAEFINALPSDAVVDIAVPASEVAAILEQLPDGCSVLIQKPMGENLKEARKILAITRRKKLNASVNFQLRYAPPVMEVRKMIESRVLGEINDIEININVYTPWQLWDFLFESPRVEILYHSIHYIDLVRSFLGNPQSVYAKTIRHPKMKELASVRTSIIMDYGDMKRANILTNHTHDFGLHQQQSYVKFEGSKGAVKIELGILKNYPLGEADKFEYVIEENGEMPEWKEKNIEGSWFPEAFIGSMMQVMLVADGKTGRADNSVEDAFHTMAVVEACYQSSEAGGIKPEPQ